MGLRQPVAFAVEMRIGVKPGQWGWSYDELEASWQAAEACGFELISCFDHVTDAPEGLAAWNAPSLLTAMATRTRRIRLSVDVISTPLRHPFLLAAQIAVAQAASGGRVEVGLGAGSGLSRLDGAALGRPFPPLRERRERLARICQVLPALWSGERVTDAALGMEEVSLGPIGIEAPLIIVGGRSRATIEIAARYADGWNAVTADADEFRDLARLADELCAEVGRERPLARAAQIFVGQIDRQGARELVRRMEEAGAQMVVFVLHRERGPDEVRRLAEEVLGR
jgi:alkanesulfonate monooxygenase SsuD/methylene tetrahydromethanopterin reductase-like flavin-dependent oxidoreductase (luciferase family)